MNFALSTKPFQQFWIGDLSNTTASEGVAMKIGALLLLLLVEAGFMRERLLTVGQDGFAEEMCTGKDDSTL